MQCQVCNNSSNNNHDINYSILIYLRANLTAHRPITKWARVKRGNTTHRNKIRKQGNAHNFNNDDDDDDDDDNNNNNNNNPIDTNQNYI
jgi:ankyrin repeat protein